MTVIMVVQLLSARPFLYLRPLPGLLQDGPQLAVLALGVLGLVPSKSDSESDDQCPVSVPSPAERDLTVQPGALLPPEGCLQRLPAHPQHLAAGHPLQVLLDSVRVRGEVGWFSKQIFLPSTELFSLQPLLHLLHGGPHVNEDVGRLQDVQLLLLLLVLVETEDVLQLISHGVGGLHRVAPWR